MQTMLNIVQECAQWVQNPTVVQMCSNAHLSKKTWDALKYKRQKVQFYAHHAYSYIHFINHHMHLKNAIRYKS